MYRQWEKNLLNTNVSHMPSQYGKLRPTNGRDLLVSLGHPSKFQRVSSVGFVITATSLIGGQPTFARCYDVWPSLGLVHYIHFLGLIPLTEFCQVLIHFTSKSCVLLHWQRYCMALQQWASAKICGVVHAMELQNFRRGHHLYLAGRPSHWALAHILVSHIMQ